MTDWGVPLPPPAGGVAVGPGPGAPAFAAPLPGAAVVAVPPPGAPTAAMAMPPPPPAAALPPPRPPPPAMIGSAAPPPPPTVAVGPDTPAVPPPAAAVVPETPIQPARPGVATPGRPALWRRIVVPLCVVLGCVLVAASVAATWVKLTALDTDTYVSTVAPLTQDENVSLAIATRVVDDVFGAVDIESIVQTVLPSQASVLAPALVAVLQRYAVQLVDDVIRSDRFQSAWVTANRIAHTQLVTLINGELIPSKAKDRVNNVVLDLQGVVDQLRAKLAVVGIELPKLDVSQTHAGQFVVAKKAQLDSIREAVELLERAAFILPIVMLVLFLLAIWLSANRARTIMWIGLGSLLALGVLAVVLRYVRRDVLGRVHDDLTRAAVESIWHDVFAGLRVQIGVVAVLALLVAFAGWFLGGSRAATWGRRTVGRDLGRVRGGRGVVSGGFATFVGRYRRPIEFVAVGVAILILLVATKLTLGLVLLAAVVVIAVLVLVELIAGPSTPEPAPEP